MPDERKDLYFETLKLLLQVAWADEQIEGDEVEKLQTYATSLSLPPAKLEELDGYLAGRVSLPPPNMGLLKSHRTDVLETLATLLGSGEEATEEERDMLSEIAGMLE